MAVRRDGPEPGGRGRGDRLVPAHPGGAARVAARGSVRVLASGVDPASGVGTGAADRGAVPGRTAARPPVAGRPGARGCDRGRVRRHRPDRHVALPRNAAAPGAPVPGTPDARAVNAALILAVVLTVATMLLALAALIGRLRRAGREVRQQIKWFGFGAAGALAVNLLALVSGVPALRLAGVVAVLTGIGLGVFRYRLYDVDRLIKRTLVYGLVTAALVGVFAALDVTLAAIVGRRSVVVASASAFVVALLLRPARSRAQGLVDRVFDRRTHDAVSILRDLGRRVGREPVEPSAIVAALRRALLDPGLQVYFAVHDGGTLVDEQGRKAEPVPVAAGQVADPVTRAGQRVAVLVHAPGDPVLLASVTRAAATVLEHARLQAELQVQLAQVRESRARLVTAGDAERRRIERDLHD